MNLRFAFGLFLLAFLLLPAATFAQVRYTLSGQVKAAGNGELLPGATVAVPALGLGATADEKGTYQLQLPAGRYQLVVSFIGYETQEIKVGSQDDFQITMKDDNAVLEEVVVEDDRGRGVAAGRHGDDPGVAGGGQRLA